MDKPFEVGEKLWMVWRGIGGITGWRQVKVTKVGRHRVEVAAVQSGRVEKFKLDGTTPRGPNRFSATCCTLERRSAELERAMLVLRARDWLSKERTDDEALALWRLHHETPRDIREAHGL